MNLRSARIYSLTSEDEIIIAAGGELKISLYVNGMMEAFRCYRLENSEKSLAIVHVLVNQIDAMTARRHDFRSSYEVLDSAILPEFLKTMIMTSGYWD